MAKRYMIGTLDNSIPARCENQLIADALCIALSDLDSREADALGLAAEIAVTLYGDNADAFIVCRPA